MMNKLRRILLTGASGFVGRAIYERLQADGDCDLILALRSPNIDTANQTTIIEVSSIDADTDWRAIADGVDVVVHSAARVHVMNDTVSDPLAEFRKINVAGTLNLARQAAALGVRRFVFVSSIKVNGEGTDGLNRYSEGDDPMPVDPYGISKMEAEQGLWEISKETGMEVVIIRPVLVYGPGVKANFRNMMSWLSRGVPLPLGAIKNKRSLVCLDNLVDLIVTCLDHPAAANQVFLAADGEDLSTTDLLRRMSKALGRPARLLPAPMWLLTFSASLLGKKDVAQRLCGSLQVDISKARQLLGWNPPVSVDEGLKRTATAFIESVRQ